MYSDPNHKNINKIICNRLNRCTYLYITPNNLTFWIGHWIDAFRLVALWGLKGKGIIYRRFIVLTEVFCPELSSTCGNLDFGGFLSMILHLHYSIFWGQNPYPVWWISGGWSADSWWFFALHPSKKRTGWKGSVVALQYWIVSMIDSVVPFKVCYLSKFCCRLEAPCLLLSQSFKICWIKKSVVALSPFKVPLSPFSPLISQIFEFLQCCKVIPLA